MKTCILSIITVMVFAGNASNVSSQEAYGRETPYPDPTRYENDIRAFEAADEKHMPPEGAIVCTGSTSMRLWHETLAKDFAPLTLIPRGFGGSNMNDLLYYTDRVVIKYKPRAVVVYQGDSDIDSGTPPEGVLDMFIQFAARIHATLPQTRIYFLSLKPSIVRWTMWPTKIKTNAMIAEWCASDSRMTFLDISTPMLDNSGNLRKDIFLEDNNHMNSTGYALWTAVVRPVLLGKELKYERSRE